MLPQYLQHHENVQQDCACICAHVYVHRETRLSDDSHLHVYNIGDTDAVMTESVGHVLFDDEYLVLVIVTAHRRDPLVIERTQEHTVGRTP